MQRRVLKLLLYPCILLLPAVAWPASTITVGKYVLTLYLPRDGYYAEEDSHVQFKVAELTGSSGDVILRPVDKARVRCVIQMPSMPSMPKFNEMAHSEGLAGVYGAHPTFPHGGEYRLTILLTPPATGREEPQEIQFEVDDPLRVNDSDPVRLAGRVRPFKLELATSPTTVEPGKPIDLNIHVIRNDQGRLGPDGQWIAEPQQVNRWEIVHEKPMHFFVIRKDLAYFSHEHPTPQPDGSFKLTYTFPAAGSYRLFADCAPFGAGTQVIGTDLEVPGTEKRKFDLAKAKVTLENSAIQVDRNVYLTWAFPSHALPVRTMLTLKAALTDKKGQPISGLEPWLGASGHMVLVHEDGETFVHSHPDDSDLSSFKNTRLPFLVRFPKPGLYRGWVQFQRSGKLITASFVFHAD
jgi:hypothetical protein